MRTSFHRRRGSTPRGDILRERYATAFRAAATASRRPLGGVFEPCERIGTWYHGQHAYLLQRMAEVDMGGHSLLDETVVFLGADIQHPASYARTDMPFVLAGGGEALRTGRWLSYDHASHNDLLVSLLRLFGSTDTTFGDPEYSTGPLANLT